MGTLQTRSYDAQDGSKRYITEVIADEVEFLTPSNGNGGYGRENIPLPTEPPMPGSGAAASSEMQPAADNDDLPF